MKSLRFGLLFSLLFAASLEASDVPKSKGNAASSNKPKPQYNTQIYEKTEDEEASFEAIVKVIREVQGDTEVFFEGKNGFFVLRSSSGHNLLAESQKKQIPVKVTVNPETRAILKVNLSLGASSGD